MDFLGQQPYNKNIRSERDNHSPTIYGLLKRRPDASKKFQKKYL